jgi:polyferredoxin
MSLAAVVGSTREKKTMIRQLLRYVAWAILITFVLMIVCYAGYGVYWMAMEQPELLIAGGIAGLVVWALIYLALTND